ncbi:MAG: hypothetical protein ACE5DI_01195 [Candidatus Micrarchaeia archaeon]
MNELTAFPNATTIATTIITLIVAGFLPGHLLTRILKWKTEFFENTIASFLLSLLILSLAGMALTFTLGLTWYSAWLAVIAITATEALILNKKLKRGNKLF